MATPAADAMWDSKSWSWKLNSRWFVLIGGPRAAIMQIANPKVGAGVADYSTYRTDPLGRLERTLDAMLTVGFGSPERREQVLGELSAIHSRVRGRTEDGAPYSALDPKLQYWVLATLIDTVLVVEQRYVGKMREIDRERYFDEGQPMAEAFGIPARHVPGSLAEFREYLADTLADLRPNDASRDIARSLLQPGMRWVPDAAFVPIDWVTIELLPTPLRRGLRLRDLNPAQLAAVRSTQAMSRTTLPRLPKQLTVNPFTGKALRDARVGAA